MRRLIQQVIFLVCVLLPGMVDAQAIQNSGTAEVNALVLDLSQATVTLNRTGAVDAALSTVTVDPPVVLADGVAFSTITVTLLDSNSMPLIGLDVSLASTRGALDTITQPLAPTDINGVTTGQIRSTTIGITQIIATETTDGVVLNDRPDVIFSLGEVLQLTKSVSPDRATVGDIVTYSVAIQNTSITTINGVSIVDAASPVLAYQGGTARLDGVAIALQVGREAALVAHGGGVAALVKQRLEPLEHLGAPAQRLGEARRAERNQHELLEIDGVVRVGPAVQDVHHWRG